VDHFRYIHRGAGCSGSLIRDGILTVPKVFPRTVISVHGVAFNSNLLQHISRDVEGPIGEGLFAQSAGSSHDEEEDAPGSMFDSILTDSFMTDLISVCIPNTVSVLGQTCFNNCESLSIVTFEADSHTVHLRHNAFFWDRSLLSLSLPSQICRNAW
jgi:hypothetical protein